MIRRGAALAALAAAVVLSSGCAGTGPDPLEPMNRRIFWFNEQADRFVLEPVARGWDRVMPGTVQTGFSNVFDNLRTPVVFLNNVLQLKPKAALIDLGRFVCNSVVGFAGVLDVATYLEIPEHDEDFGQTLGYWGVPPGPYLVLPLLGPSNPRDTVGLVADGVSQPANYVLPLWIRATRGGVNVVNTRASLLETIEQERESAFDFYIFVRDAFLQNRRYRVRDEAEPEAESQDDLYYPEDEELE